MEYTAPTSQSIQRNQNGIAALRLLLAQRLLYAKAKRWAMLRAIGTGFIALAAPIVVAVEPSAATTVGSLAAVWLFLSRTIFTNREKYFAARGAYAQELFDTEIFGMPELARREPRVTLEEVSRLVGTDAQVIAAAKRERLLDWYTIEADLNGESTIAIAQRSNAAYSDRLLSASTSVWLGVSVIWFVLAVAIGIFESFSLATFLVAVALPILPAGLDVYDQWRKTKGASLDRRAMASDIESEVLGAGGGRLLSAQDLLGWQAQLYDLGRDAPQIPELVYKRTRSKNERAMSAAVARLAEASRRSGHSRGE